MKKIVLHIGTEKTGTTSIQTFLSANRERLSKQGIHVPDFLGGDCHRKLAVMAFNEDRSDDFIVSERLVDLQARRSTLMSWREEFARKVNESKEERWIISCEHLQSRLTTTEEVERLRDILSTLFDEVEVVLYVRKPIDGAISLWSTGIRFGGTYRSLPPPSNAYWENVFHHRNTIDRWKSVFPGGIRVRLFEGRGTGGKLLGDFSEVAGIQWSGGFTLPNVENETLSWSAMKVLAELNRLIPPLKDQRRNPLRRDLTNHITRHFSGLPRYVPSAEETAAYEAHFSESDEWVRCEFFPERDELWSVATPSRGTGDDGLFSKDFTPLETAFVNALADIWKAKVRRIVRLERKVRKARKQEDILEKH